MALFDEIDLLVEQAEAADISLLRRQRIALYAAGLKGKLRQAELALSKLSEFENQSDDYTTQSVPEGFAIKEKVHFYCDAYWTFLFSSLDVLAQLTNQAMKLKLEERNASFKDVNNKLQGNKYKGSQVAKRFDICLRSHAFRNLDKYRNCSIHRRQIFIKETATSSSESVTDGYPTTGIGPTVTVTRILCDDPLYVKATVAQGRPIPGYLADTRDKVLGYIQDILRQISVVK